MHRVLSLLICLLVSAAVSAQTKPIQLGENGSDCIGALMINDTVVGPVYSPKGYGKKLEIRDYELGDPYFIEREHNTVWYKFVAPYDAIFTFELVPIVKEDDFDFLLFQYDGPNFCQDILDGNKIPVRTNISRKNLGTNGRTGLSENAIEEYVPSGPGSPYSKALRVYRGEMFYLLVDNPFKENEGHSIHLKYRKLSPEAAAQEEERVYETPYRKLEITVTDKATKERLASNISINGLPDSVQSRYPAISQLELDVVSYRTYDISVVKKGYLLATQNFIPKNDSLYKIDITLKSMSLGDKINLENIKFDSDKTEILEKSLPALKQLSEFMEINPTVTIEIQGHVNGESKRNKRKFVKLSEARAQAIYDKLAEAGVNKSRMNVVGFGNSKMIYPTPINNRQSEANRRVEAEIKSL